MSTNKSIIFHHPMPIVSDGMSGSRVRPFRILEAFQQLGYQVEAVVGVVEERQRALQHLQHELAKGRPFAFAYSESTSQPNGLAGTARVGNLTWKRAAFETQFFVWLKRRGIPLGLYYRDIYWKFPVYREVTTRRRRAVTIPLYWYDWLTYLFLVDHLFLPSQAMQATLPYPYPAGRVSALPPGCTIPPIFQQRLPKTPSDMLELFYVGGVRPPLYDLTPMFNAVQASPHLVVTICCREHEWREVQSYYGPLDTARVRIVHQQGDELAVHYARADLFVLIRNPDPYLDFAMPVKVFESLGYGLPIVAIEGTGAARFVAQEDIGWVAADEAELVQLLRYLHAHPELIREKRRHIEVVRERHTWLARAQTVADILTSTAKRVDKE